MPQALPANPNLDWLKKAAKQRLVELRAEKPDAKLHQAQLAIASDYGFKSWRALKAHVDAINPASRDRDCVFAAAHAGDVEAVRRAFASGFDPATPGSDGRTIQQIAKDLHHEDVQGAVTRGPKRRCRRSVGSWKRHNRGILQRLARAWMSNPQLIDALGGGFQKATALHLAALRNQHAAIRLLIKRGADLDSRDFPDNELLPVPRTLGLGVMMGLEVADGTTQFQPGVQARGGAVGARTRGVGSAGGA